MSNQHLVSPIRYREDINGLRAYAVMAVLLFHFSLIGLQGGFVGVDAFFVISGYLMTAIVIGAIQKERFSLKLFYIARARRILPALMTVIIFLLILGWFWLPTADYKSLGDQSIYAVTLLSNLHYWFTADYFDVAAHEKWLLHTWSLSVEAQFYFIFPIFVMIIWKICKNVKYIAIAMIILFVFSFILNLYFSHYKPVAAFYLLPMRGWELATGSIVYFLSNYSIISKRNSLVIYYLGWLMLFGSFFLIKQTFYWPSYWALIPVMGTALIISSKHESGFFTNNYIAQWLGDRSYSIYLWHWPLVVMLYFINVQNEWIWVIFALSLSLLLGHLSYHFIENPTRAFLSKSNILKEIIILICVGLIIIFTALLIKTVNFSNRFSPEIEAAANEALNKNENRDKCHVSPSPKGSPSCLNGHGKLGAIFLGDSHVASTVSAFGIAAVQNNKSIMQWSFSGCSPINNLVFVNSPFDACKNANDWAINKLKNIDPNIPLVLLGRYNNSLFGNSIPKVKLSKEYSSSNDPNYRNEIYEKIVDTGCYFAKNRKTFMMKPLPEMPFSVPQRLSRNMIFKKDYADLKINIDSYYKTNELIIKAIDAAHLKCGIIILDPVPYLCDKQYCYGSKNDFPLYFDDNHLTDNGNQKLIPLFEKVFQ